MADDPLSVPTGNVNQLNQQMLMQLYLQRLRGESQSAKNIAPSWTGALGATVNAIADAKQERDLMRSIQDMNQGAAGTVPSLPSDDDTPVSPSPSASTDTNPAGVTPSASIPASTADPNVAVAMLNQSSKHETSVVDLGQSQNLANVVAGVEPALLQAVVIGCRIRRQR